MENILEKLDSYNILNNLLPGVILDYLFKKMLGFDLVEGSILENLFLYYFLGMIVSRIGSHVIEPICKKIKWVKYSDYGDFVKASRIDKKIDMLSEINNIYRTLLAGCIILIGGKIYLFVIAKFNILSSFNKVIVLIILTTIFALSYRKQTSYVANRVKKVSEENEK